MNQPFHESLRVLTALKEETKYDVPQGVSKSGICGKSGCREETKYDAPQGVSKSGICSKGGCREEEKT